MSQHDSTTIRKPRTDDRPLWDVVFGVYGYPAVLLAHKFKLFPLLAQHPCTLQEVGDTLKIARRPAEAILTAATALGFLHLQDGLYSLTPLSEDYLLESSPTYFGEYLDLIIATYSVCPLESLEKAVLTNSPQAYGSEDIYKSHEEQDALARTFTRGMHGISIGCALSWPEAIDLSKHRVMLDIGGGSGSHAIGATLRWPNLRAIVFDLAPVCKVAEEFIARHGVQERIRTQAGDVWQDPFPSTDLYFCSNVYQNWSLEKCRLLTQKSFASLESGGRIILHEPLYNDQKTGPFPTAAFNLIMLLWVEGEAHSGRELSAMLAEAGFTGIEVKPTWGYWSIITGRKP
jgi:hypothetical protein